MLGRNLKDFLIAHPTRRDTGAPVQFQQVNDDAALGVAITAALTHATQSGHRNIAIIAKTAQRCRTATTLVAQTPQPIALIDSVAFEYSGGIVSIPVHPAKGIEFDVAIVIDTNAHTYTDTEFDERLLYVAVTRPMHALYILWQGQLSTYLHDDRRVAARFPA